MLYFGTETAGGTVSLFGWLISHQPAVLFSQNKPTTSQQYSSLKTNQHQPSATSQPNKLCIRASFVSSALMVLRW
jgi:hypothetical protein